MTERQTVVRNHYCMRIGLVSEPFGTVAAAAAAA